MRLLQFGLLALLLAVGSAGAATKAKAHATAMKSQPAAHAAVGPVWDWAKIDTNKDNLIEPEEMEAWLKANPGVQKGG